MRCGNDYHSDDDVLPNPTCMRNETNPLSHSFPLSVPQATWILGAALVSAYVLVAVGFWVHTDEPLEHNG